MISFALFGDRLELKTGLFFKNDFVCSLQAARRLRSADERLGKIFTYYANVNKCISQLKKLS